MPFTIITFGCKLNQAESDMISADLISAGFSQATRNQQPDFVIVNVCAVTHKAVREGRQKVAYLKRKYPKAKVVVTGCINEDNWEGVDFWVSNKDKDKIKDKLNPEADRYKKRKTHKVDLAKNRAFIKIQTGCNNFCSYCIIPFMRGRPKSRSSSEIIDEILQKEKQGYKEIVLTGVNIGLYHQETKLSQTQKRSQPRNQKSNSITNTNLAKLLELVLKNTSLERIRLGSLWPTHVNSKLVNLISKNPRLCPHLHLSIQSGSDKILKSMNRGYRAKDVLKITNQARKKISNINFTCDIIVGFPGETEKDFQDSCELIEKIGFSKAHIFKYSPRPHTKASLMPDQVPESVKQKRSQILHELASEFAQKTKQQFIGRTFPVLWEEKKQGYWYGFTDNYIRVKQSAKGNLKNEINQLKIKKGNIIPVNPVNSVNSVLNKN